MVQLALAGRGARTSAGQVNEMSQSVQIEPDATSTIAQDADGRLVAVSHHLGNLLRAFHSVLEAVDGLPIAPVVPSDYRRSGIASRLHALPRPRWLLRYFVVVHIHFVVNVSLVPQLGVIGWYRVNRELRDLGYAHGSGRLGHFPLGMSWVAFSVTVYRTHRRVRRAYRASVPAARSRAADFGA